MIKSNPPTNKKYNWKDNLERKFENEFDKLKFELKYPNEDPNAMLKDVHRRFEKIVRLRRSDFDRQLFIGQKPSLFGDLFINPSYILAEFEDRWGFEKDFEAHNQRLKCLIATGDKDRVICADLENIFNNPIILSNVDGPDFDSELIFKKNTNYIIIYNTDEVGKLFKKIVETVDNVELKSVKRIIEQRKYFVTDEEYENEKMAFIGATTGLKPIQAHGSEIRETFNKLITSFGSIQNVLRCINLV